MYTDYHLHSSFSDDSQTPMEDMVRRAAALGLEEICFTEHVDYGVKTVVNCDYAAYFAKLAEMREKYRGQITIRAGIEFGVQLETIPEFTAAFQRWPFDFVIYSCHQIDNQEFWRKKSCGRPSRTGKGSRSIPLPCATVCRGRSPPAVCWSCTTTWAAGFSPSAPIPTTPPTWRT